MRVTQGLLIRGLGLGNIRFNDPEPLFGTVTGTSSVRVLTRAFYLIRVTRLRVLGARQAIAAAGELSKILELQCNPHSLGMTETIWICHTYVVARDNGSRAR